MPQILLGVVLHQNYSRAGEENFGVSGWTLVKKLEKISNTVNVPIAI